MINKTIRVLAVIFIPFVFINMFVLISMQTRASESVVEKIVVEKIPQVPIEQNVNIYKTEVTEPEHITEDTEEVPLLSVAEMNRWGITLTEDEINTLARIVFLESGTESDYAQWATIAVILNRMKDPRFGSTLYEVLSAPNQFSTWSYRNKGLIRDKEMNNIALVLYGVVSEHTDNMHYLFFGLGKGSSAATKIDHQWFW